MPEKVSAVIEAKGGHKVLPCIVVNSRPYLLLQYTLHRYEGCVHQLIPCSQLYTLLLYTLYVGILISSTDTTCTNTVDRLP